MPVHRSRRSLRVALVSLVSLSVSLAASAEDSDVGDNIKKSTREAAHAVAGAGEKVSKKIQGESNSDGELVDGMRTNTGRGYGSAGCGLGSILFEPGSGFTQVLAATTNASFGTQTFGITSGTSNCASPRRGVDAARAFVEANRPALARDMARGGGETVSSLAQLAGCSRAERVGQHLQRRFADIFPSTGRNDREVSQSVVDALRTEAALGCRAL